MTEQMRFCEMQRDGGRRCLRPAAKRLTVTVDDRGSAFDHHYCDKHASEAANRVTMAAGLRGRLGVVHTKVERYP